MEEVLALLLGTGAVVFSPFLIPGLRPVAKSAIKGGMAVADATRSAVAATAEGCRDAVNKASEALKPAPRETAAPDAAVAQDVPDVAKASPVTEPAARAAPLNLNALRDALAHGGASVVAATSGAFAHATKQWSQIMNEAQAELDAERKSAGPAELADAAASAAPDAASAPTSAAASAAAAPADGPDDLQQIRGIGPKAAEFLQTSGVTTYEQLAAMSPEQLRELLATAGGRYRVVDPSAWPAEAQRLSEARGK